MNAIAYVLLMLVIVAPLLLGVWWLLWQLWMVLIAYFWVNAPANIAEPGYWYFVGAWVLIGLLLRTSSRK